MKKIAIFVMAVLLWTFSPLSSSASLLRHDFTAVEGPVVKKSVDQNQITVRSNSSGADETYNADPAQFSSVKEGDTVLILHQIDSPTIGTVVVTKPGP